MNSTRRGLPDEPKLVDQSLWREVPALMPRESVIVRLIVTTQPCHAL